MSWSRYMPFGDIEHVDGDFRTNHVLCSWQRCTRIASKRCDFVDASGRRCDASICKGCALPTGKGLDHCPAHT